MSDAILEAIAVLHEAVNERTRQAYERGFRAGQQHTASEGDAIAYRRGYFAGYSAMRRSRVADPEGRKPGRPRLHEQRLESVR